MNIKRVRALVALGVFVVVGIGLAMHTGTGTISSMGYGWIAAVCPLGSLEALFGSWAFVPRLLIALAVVLLACIFVGKAFCSWVCPVPHIQNLFKTRKRRQQDADLRDEAAARSLARWRDHAQPKHSKVTLDSRHVVLGGALLSASIFGFPVFCLVCPIGLTVAEFVLLWRMLQFNELTWALVVFPLIVIAEVVILRRWCHTLCPMGTLLSLLSALNKTARPSVDASLCLRDKDGAACKACAAACPESIDPHSNLGDRPLTECIKCGNCKLTCPVGAIRFPWIEKKDTKG